MAVLIDMDMPKNCDECPISRYQELHDCPILRKFSTKHSEKRLDNCPLKSADEMIQEIRNYANRENTNISSNKTKRIVAEVILCIIHDYCDKEKR